MRKSGLSDAAIKKIGDEERFVDSPLSARGVNEALTLQRNLTLTPDAPWYTLGGVARCALARTCEPLLLTSNRLDRYFVETMRFDGSEGANFRVVRFEAGARSYMAGPC